MTPLAQAIANDSCLSERKRRFAGLADEIRIFDGLHFFECTAVYEASVCVADKLVADRTAKARDLIFLAAPRMLVEIATPAHLVTQRQALLIEQSDGYADVRVLLMARKDGWVSLLPGAISVPTRGSEDKAGTYIMRASDEISRHSGLAAAWDNLAAGVIAILAMINTPRIIARTQHQPHVGLQRKIAAAHGMPGKYPLRAWTELKLEVTQPRMPADASSCTKTLTGGKALHFCRSHLRVKAGRVEWVTAHWRGDPALGIKQTRYSIVPPQNGAWPAWAHVA